MNLNEQNENTAPRTTHFRRIRRNSVEKPRANGAGLSWEAFFPRAVGLRFRAFHPGALSPDLRCARGRSSLASWGEEVAVAL